MPVLEKQEVPLVEIEKFANIFIIKTAPSTSNLAM